jgi:7-cyano-7-deazaguanine reductase
MSTHPVPTLETFPIRPRSGIFHIHMEIPEFTCLCPKTGQPDFATLILDYIPARTCVELKSLKLYIWSFRNTGCFHEDVTNRILDDLASADETSLHAADGPLLRPRRHLHHGRRRTPPERLDASAGGATRGISQSIQHPGPRS